MINIGFDLINTYGQVIEENENYSLYHLKEVKDRYDSNFMKLHEMPDEQQFEQLVAHLRSFALQYGLEHGKMVLPEGVKPNTKLVSLAEALGFEWSLLELYEVKPHQFNQTGAPAKQELQVGWISPELVDKYEQMHYEEKVQWGEEYAKAISKYKNGIIERGEVNVVVALLNGELVGSVDVICSERFVELDDFFVKTDYQKQGIGTAIQQFIMQEAGERTVILVADGEDTPKEMYKRQGYRYVTFQYAALCQKLMK